MLIALEVVGIVAFALVGAIDAVRREADLFGLAVAAIVTAIGGGVLRDVLLGINPPTGLRTWWYFPVCLAAALVAFWLPVRVIRLRLTVQFADAIGLAMFSMTGASVAMAQGAPVYVAAMIGMINGVGGGVLREVLLGRAPQIMRKDVYALPSFAGGLIFALGLQFGVAEGVLAAVVLASTVSIRMASVIFSWNLAVCRLDRRSALPARRPVACPSTTGPDSAVAASSKKVPAAGVKAGKDPRAPRSIGSDPRDTEPHWNASKAG